MILDFYDVKYYWNNDVPIIELIIKNNKKITTEKCSFIGSTVNWFIHYFGEETGKLLYNERKKLFCKNNLIDWYIKNFLPADKDALVNYKIKINKKISKALLNHYSSDAGLITKQKLRVKCKKWGKIIGKQNSDRWKNDKSWRKRQMQYRRDIGMYDIISKKLKIKHADKDFKEYFLKRMNDPHRIKIISEKAKEMWYRAKHHDKNLYYRMANSAKNKKFNLNGYFMNSIEYQIGIILNDLNISWVYEPLINLEKKTFLPDFKIKNKKIIIECYGDFWHGNPLFFNETGRTHKKRTIKEIWEYDNMKKQLFIDAGYEYIIFWENDINNAPDEIILELKQYFNKLEK